MNTQQRATLLTLVSHAREAYKISSETADGLRAALDAGVEPAVQEGYRLVPIAKLAVWKSAVNETAARSIKAERWSYGASLKQSIADVINAAPQPPAQPAPLMRPDAAIKLQAAELIDRAVALGIVVTIERRALKPLAMGHAEYRIETRPARVAS